jgi:hypothetical protein
MTHPPLSFANINNLLPSPTQIFSFSPSSSSSHRPFPNSHLVRFTMCPKGGSWRTEIADNQEEISEHVRKTIEDCKKSTGRVSLNEQGHLIVKINKDDTGADLPSLARQYFGDQQLGYTVVAVGEDGELRESSVMIFTRTFIDDLMEVLHDNPAKEENNDEHHNSPPTGLLQRYTITMAENAHEDPNSREGSTHHERPLDARRLEIEKLRREEANAEDCLFSTKACIEANQAQIEIYQARLAETEARMEEYQARLKAHQARLGPDQARLADVQARLAAGRARLSAANKNELGMS